MPSLENSSAFPELQWPEIRIRKLVVAEGSSAIGISSVVLFCATSFFVPHVEEDE